MVTTATRSLLVLFLSFFISVAFAQEVTTLMGSRSLGETHDGYGNLEYDFASFQSIRGMAFDSKGNLFVMPVVFGRYPPQE